ncbi:TIR domain-containing protein [Algirhabdus cladophorae]|uniref:TIR domain-containing protein n=1 Tax=Algirhabdus cladophorae TaxID=3377108 RepID=UPI003B849955
MKIDIKCRLGRAAAGTALESKLTECLLEHGVQSFSELSSIVFDFSEVNFIDAVSLQVLVAYVLTCDKYDVHVEIEFPKVKYLRDQIRAWSLDSAISLATTRNLHWFATELSKDRYFSEADRQMSLDLDVLPKGEFHPDAYPSNANGVLSDGLRRQDARLIPRRENFFAFQSFDGNTSDALGVATREKDDWQKQDVASFIEARIGVDVQYLSSRIIFEALHNALRHSNAEIVQTATFFGRSRTKKLPDTFALSSTPFENSRTATTHFWDDGAPMLHSYNRKLGEKEAPVRLTKDPDFRCEYRVRIESDHQDDEFRVSSDEDISFDSPDWKKLISLTFPEVSSALDRIDHGVAEETEMYEDARLSAKGMGLYLMLHAATTVQNGTLTIRTGNMRARFAKNNLKGRRRDEAFSHDYNVKIKVYTEVLPEFRGNLISIGMGGKDLNVGATGNEKGRDKKTVELTLSIEFHEFTDQRRSEFIRSFTELLVLPDESAKIKKITKGSTKIQVQVTTAQAEQILWLAHRGILSEIGVVDAKVLGDEAAAALIQSKAESEKFDVFLCHSTIDKSEVKKIALQLRSYGIMPWFDEWQVRPGLSWQRVLEQQIHGISTAAVFVGKSGIGAWQEMEIEAFLRKFAELKNPIIPALLSGCSAEPDLPLFLNAFHWVDFRKKDPNPLDQLVWGITGRRIEAHPILNPETKSDH